ncbi:MAG: methyltransferase domain-containing protein [Anaerolineales bacterium]|nr:methyltransferase domain-containing protein [Anaerolineae bacterium]MBL6979661.1 methyltransferase domain-containing protein [Anaerolineales bacterium]
MTHPPICDYEGSNYQTSFWDQGGRAYEDGAEAIALRRLLPDSGHLLLELGAGAGRNTPRYSGFERVVLLDYSLTQLQQAQERLGKSARYMYVAGDVYRLPFVDGLFDASTMIRVLHHLAEAPRALTQIRRVMKEQSTFILEFASKLNLKAILRYVLRQQKWSPFTPEQVEFVPLNFDFHPKTVRAWLDEADFDIQRQLTVSHFRIDLLKRLVPTQLLVAMDSIAQLTGNWWQLTPSVFVKSQAVGKSSTSNGFFQCPECVQPLDEKQPTALVCTGCGNSWPVVDGIYDFRGK